MMKMMRYWMFGAMTVIAVLMPLHGASAWDYSGGGYHGGGYHGGGYRGGSYGGYHGGGYRGGYRGGYHGGYHGGYRGGYYYGGGCRGCDAVGAGIVGLAIGTIIGSAIVAAEPPPVVVQSPPLLPPRGCAPVIMNGKTYYDCNGGRGGYYEDW